MKSLPLLRPTIFLMVGVPGAGKSYFARRFSDKYDLPYISADRLRSDMFNDPQYTPGEQAVVNRITNYLFEELTKTKRSFIIDGLIGNIRSQRVAIERKARRSGFYVITVWVQVDQVTARMRSTKRNVNKVDDMYNQSMPETSFIGLARQLTPLSATENHVVISGKHTFETQVSAVLRKLPKPRLPEQTRVSIERPQNQQTPPQQQKSLDSFEHPGDMTVKHVPSRQQTLNKNLTRQVRVQRPANKRGIPITGD